MANGYPGRSGRPRDDWSRNEDQRRGPSGGSGAGYDYDEARRAGSYRREGDGYGQGLSDRSGHEHNVPRYGREERTTSDLDYLNRDFDDHGFGDRGYTPYNPPRGNRAGNPYRDRNVQQGGSERDLWDRASDEVASWFGDDGAEHRREMDRHRGKGPKGYKRTDTRIEEDLNDRLSEDNALDASDIEVSVSDGEVTLTGFVGDRFDKRRAEDLADSVSGVTHVQNNLRVRKGDPTTAGFSGP